jgi:hypothetical protein
MAERLCFERTWMTRSVPTLFPLPNTISHRCSRSAGHLAGSLRRWCGPIAVAVTLALAGCGSESPKPAAEAEQKPAAPAVPEDVQSAAESLLGSGTQVLLFGDLAKTGTEQLLAANVVPNTPKSTVAGTVVTRAVVAEKVDGNWTELLRADEYLKDQKGYLAMTPLQAVTGWKLQYEQNPQTGVSLYFTPVTQSGANGKTLPIAVRWNPEKKRYQSMDMSYQHFLNESPSLASPRSVLK